MTTKPDEAVQVVVDGQWTVVYYRVGVVNVVYYGETFHADN